MKRHKTARRSPWVGKLVLYAVLATASFFFLLPLVWMISSSLKANEDVFKMPIEWIPGDVQWSNFARVMEIVPMWRYIANSIYVTGMVLIGNVVSCSFVAFGFAFYRFPLRSALFILLLSTMMLPGQVTMVPTFKLFSMLGWIDTYKPLIIPAFFASPFFVFLFRQFYLTLPKDLFEAGRIDGLGPFGLYRHIGLPIVRPAAITVAIFSFMAAWNDYMGPLIYISSAEKFPLALGLASFRGQYYADWNLLMAGSLIALLPCIVLFLCAQRYFIQGIATSGLKV